MLLVLLLKVNDGGGEWREMREYWWKDHNDCGFNAHRFPPSHALMIPFILSSSSSTLFNFVERNDLWIFLDWTFVLIAINIWLLYMIIPEEKIRPVRTIKRNRINNFIENAFHSNSKLINPINHHHQSFVYLFGQNIQLHFIQFRFSSKINRQHSAHAYLKFVEQRHALVYNQNIRSTSRLPLPLFSVNVMFTFWLWQKPRFKTFSRTDGLKMNEKRRAFLQAISQLNCFFVFVLLCCTRNWRLISHFSFCCKSWRRQMHGPNENRTICLQLSISFFSKYFHCIDNVINRIGWHFSISSPHGIEWIGECKLNYIELIWVESSEKENWIGAVYVHIRLPIISYDNWKENRRKEAVDGGNVSMKREVIDNDRDARENKY